LRVAVIVPALNEQESIAAVVTEVVAARIAGVPGDRVDPVIVVDNGSTDRTAEVARAAGARVVREERRGYGYACAAGVAATGPEVDVLVFMDGDGSDDAGQMDALLAPLVDDRADLVLGSRVLGPRARGALLPHQRLGNALTTALVGLLYGQRVTDLPPFKAIRRSLLAELDMREMTYGWTVEMIVKCARHAGHRRKRCRIVEVPVSTRPRLGGRSKVSGTLVGTLLAAYYMLSTTVKYAWRD
jgi:glycosyltransferase involved in cell wall biosynthesis